MQRKCSFVDTYGINFIELAEQLFIVITQCLEQRSNRQLAAAVNTHMKNIFYIKLKIEPGTSYRNNSCRIEALVGGVGFSVIMGIEKTRGTLKLVHDHPLSTIDNKDTICGHQRKRTEKDLLFFYITNSLYTGGLINIKGDQAYSYLDWNVITHSPLNTLLDGIFIFTKGVADKLKRTESVKIVDGKHFLKDCLEAEIFPLTRINIHLQEPFIRMTLHGNKMRRIYNFTCLGKAFSYSIHDPSQYIFRPATLNAITL